MALYREPKWKSPCILIIQWKKTFNGLYNVLNEIVYNIWLIFRHFSSIWAENMSFNWKYSFLINWSLPAQPQGPRGRAGAGVEVRIPGEWSFPRNWTLHFAAKEISQCKAKILWSAQRKQFDTPGFQRYTVKPKDNTVLSLVKPVKKRPDYPVWSSCR